MEAIFGPAYISFCFSVSSSIGKHCFFGFCKDKAKKIGNNKSGQKLLREKRKEKKGKGKEKGRIRKQGKARKAGKGEEGRKRQGRQEKARQGCAGFSLMLLSSIVQHRAIRWAAQSNPLDRTEQTAGQNRTSPCTKQCRPSPISKPHAACAIVCVNNT